MRDGAKKWWTAVLLAAAGLTAYEVLIRPWSKHWGATRREAQAPLPGDELLGHARLATTHAITINAPARRVWPWLVQMGQGRGGFYSYWRLENLLGAQIRNADRILTEHQDLAAGDTVPFEPGGTGMTVVRLEPERALVLAGGVDARGEPAGTPPNPLGLRATWAFVLRESGAGATRLIVRLRMDWRPSPVVDAGAHLLLEPGHFIMERKMLLQLKHLAERRSEAGGEDAA